MAKIIIFYWVKNNRLEILGVLILKENKFLGYEGLSIKFEVSIHIQKVDGTFLYHCFFHYLHQFPASKKVQIAGNITSCYTY